MNVFEYAYRNEVLFENQCAEIGYKRQTTFIATFQSLKCTALGV